MLNKLKYVLILVFFVLLFLGNGAGSSFAATSLRLQAPSSQTNRDSLSLAFVAQTTTSNNISVQCYMKGPSDGGFLAIGAVFNLTSPGNTNTCNFNLNQGNGTYQFKAVANAGSENAESTTSTEKNNTAPGTPYNYNKEKTDACTYKISFRTADDGGKTSKIVLYRSTESNFSLDESHKSGSQSIGSNTDGSFTDVLPDCGKTYYYALRAFDMAGNTSGAVGDQSTTVTNPVSEVSPTQTPGAIAINDTQSTVGEEISPSPTDDASKEVLGTKDTTQAQKTTSQNPVSNGVNWITGHKKISLVTLVFLAIGAYLILRYRKIFINRFNLCNC